MLQHQLAERGELDREGESASEAHTKALEGDGEHVFVKVRTRADGRAAFLQGTLQAAQRTRMASLVRFAPEPQR
jgi:hypothetical protein